LEPVWGIAPQAAVAQTQAPALPACHRDLLWDAILKANPHFHPSESPVSLRRRRGSRLEGERRACMVKTGSEEYALS